MSYFVVNKQQDYDMGFLFGGEYRNGRLSVRKDADGGACFISRLFDSREDETEWGRFVIDARSDVGAGLQISFYTSATPEITYQNQKRRIQELISDRKITAEKKKDIFKPLFQKRFVGFKDMLLYGIRGRYLFFIIDLYRQEDDNTCGDMCIYFPKASWLQYLPGVYSQNPQDADFTERFLGIFQSFYEDMAGEIRNSAGLLHPAPGERATLEELARWYDFSDAYLWPDDRLIELIRRAPYLRKKVGTIGGLKEYLTLYTGTTPEIWEDDLNPNQVIVSVPEEYLTDMREYRVLLRIIGQMLPAGMEARVTPLLKSGETLKAISIGVNSYLGGLEDVESDGSQYPGMILEDDREAEK